ncbi:tight adherence pilus pseudopilin TadF [Kluyvera ascorbata]|uniref:tight adherence pilus pseudopilin TadF n=1 Tax=Kluyvera ascorbata TaxID=51288 RepID=UPI0016230EFC|nr:tight adherence pilus pseudopilin TadF [Kluyvera ascorbata]
MIIKFVKSNNGAAAIEFAFYIFVFVLMCGFMVDMSFSLIKKSQVERVNNSLIAVLRERVNFFNGRTDLTQDDLSQLKSIADILLVNDDGTVAPYQLGLKMVSFSSRSTQQNPIPIETHIVTQSISRCDLNSEFTSTADLSTLSAWGIPPASTANTPASWYPVYEVTLCVPGAASWFFQAMGTFNRNLGSIYVRNATIPRL